MIRHVVLALAIAFAPSLVAAQPATPRAIAGTLSAVRNALNIPVGRMLEATGAIDRRHTLSSLVIKPRISQTPRQERVARLGVSVTFR